MLPRIPGGEEVMAVVIRGEMEVRVSARLVPIDQAIERKNIMVINLPETDRGAGGFALEIARISLEGATFKEVEIPRY